MRLTDLVELKSVELGAGLGQQLLGGLAIRAVRLGEDGCAKSASRLGHKGCCYKRNCVPTPFWSIMFCALVFADDMLAGLVARVKKLRTKLMVGDL
jgi:hypothetical protein